MAAFGMLASKRLWVTKNKKKIAAIRAASKSLKLCRDNEIRCLMAISMIREYAETASLDEIQKATELEPHEAIAALLVLEVRKLVIKHPWRQIFRG